MEEWWSAAGPPREGARPSPTESRPVGTKGLRDSSSSRCDRDSSEWHWWGVD